MRVVLTVWEGAGGDRRPQGTPPGVAWVYCFPVPSNPGWIAALIDVDADLPTGPGGVLENMGDPEAATWHDEQLSASVTNKVASQLGVSNATMRNSTRAECSKSYCVKFDLPAVYGLGPRIVTLFHDTTRDPAREGSTK